MFYQSLQVDFTLIMTILSIFAYFSACPFASAQTSVPEEISGTLPITAQTSARLSSDIQCAQHRGQRLENRTEAIICCNSSFSRFKQNWQREGSLLTELLVTLKNWDCPQFVNECQQPSYNFTDFTSLVYENACNQTVFRRKCFSRLQTIVWKRNLNPGDWGSIVRSLLNLNMEEDELTEACVQVALYEAVSEFRGSVHGYYHEIKRTLLPFCDFVWCGLDAQNVHDNWASAWMCMPPSCRSNLIAVMVVCSILSLICFLENAMVIFVYTKDKELRDSQGVFKLSLGFSDLIAAGIIYPTFANSLSKVTMSREIMGTPYNESAVVGDKQRFDSLPRYPGGDAWSHFDQPYLDFVGFFTSLHLSVTIFTFIMASADRILFYKRYLAYSKGNAKKFAVLTVPATWLAGVAVAIPSLFVNRYTLIASILVLSSGSTALLFYVVAFGIPIITMWILSTVTLVLNLKKARRIKSVTTGNERLMRDVLQEDRHAKTLCIMVGTFSLSLILGCISAVAALVLGEDENGFPINENRTSVKMSLEFVSIVFLISNSFWNFFVQFARDSKFRKTTLGLFLCSCSETQISREAGMAPMDSTTTLDPVDKFSHKKMSSGLSTTQM